MLWKVHTWNALAYKVGPKASSKWGYNPYGQSYSFIRGRLSGWFNSVCNWIRGPPGRDVKQNAMSPKGGLYVSVETWEVWNQTIPVKLMEQNDDSWIGN